MILKPKSTIYQENSTLNKPQQPTFDPNRPVDSNSPEPGPSLNRMLFLIGLMLLVFALDQMSKQWAIDTLQGQPIQTYFGGWLRLMYAENRGAWGGLGAEWPEIVRLLVMTVLPLIVLAWLGFRIFTDGSMPQKESTGYALFISGGLGNLIDRIRFDYVVDFLWMGMQGSWFSTNIFNIADMAIMAAVGFLISDMLTRRPETPTQAA